jgi:hypothetical protein
MVTSQWTSTISCSTTSEYLGNETLQILGASCDPVDVTRRTMAAMTVARVRDWLIILAALAGLAVGAVMLVGRMGGHPSAQERACQAQQADLDRFVKSKGMVPIPRSEARAGVRACITTGTLP